MATTIDLVLLCKSQGVDYIQRSNASGLAYSVTLNGSSYPILSADSNAFYYVTGLESNTVTVAGSTNTSAASTVWVRDSLGNVQSKPLIVGTDSFSFSNVDFSQALESPVELYFT